MASAIFRFTLCARVMLASRLKYKLLILMIESASVAGAAEGMPAA